MNDRDVDLKNCPVCADSRISLQVHGEWCWVACATCHYRGPAMRDTVSAIAEYNSQRDIIAQYTVPRSELSAVTAERDEYLKRMHDCHRMFDKYGLDEYNELLDVLVDRTIRELFTVKSDRDALSDALADVRSQLSAVTAERDAFREKVTDAIEYAKRLLTQGDEK